MAFNNFFKNNISSNIPIISFPLTIVSIPQENEKYNRQNAQITGSNVLKFCTSYLLTFCWRGGIIENSARLGRGRAVKENRKGRDFSRPFQ